MDRRSILTLAALFVGCAHGQGGPITSTAPCSTSSVAATSTSTSAWQVDNPPGPKSEVRIDTDEGTWMAVDVSPDGTTVVFDLLGDIYVMPITGGAAKAITHGLSWDMQPRFSPDGQWIVFVSDRDGGDNVWLVRSDGGDLRQVTKEKVHEISSPTWTPDGQYVALRKHFTSERSLGAGEIWLYHRSGGTGVMMTKRPDDQKDLGEPAFSPDGRYLYYSQDVTGGSVFRYNKDPHAGIYAINRLERDSGRIERFVYGPGGAVAPTPSPDGKTIAFVRRHGLSTALYVHDVESGAERRVYDGLDRDMQETWAVHGVYPAMAWTPDSGALVFSAKGKIRRHDFADGKTAVIPFRVQDTRTVLEALRFAVDVHPEQFHTRMLRWTTASPDGRSAMFQTLGHLYTRPLEGGDPKRLTHDEDIFEHHPSYARDGRFVVYTTWNDQALGSVRIVAARGGKSRTITDAPGHYVDPVFTPDGRHVVYQKVGAHSTRARTWTRTPGLYVVPAAGGAPVLIRRGGHHPHFGAGGDRVFFMSESGNGAGRRRLLSSIELDGSDERTHVKSPLAMELRVSPDGRWLAFRDGYQVYLMPLPATGRPIEIGPKSEALPVARVSRDGGAHLHFSADSQRLHWSMGPQLFTRDLKDAFQFMNGAPEAPLPPPEAGIDLGFDVPSDRPDGKLAFVGGQVVTMRGDEVIEDGVVLVDGNRITAVGRRSELPVPEATRVIDATGMTIVPGFVDVHHHGPQGGQGIIPQANWALHAMLTFGVTTVHDPSAHTATIFAASELVRAGVMVGPRIFSTGTILYGARIPIKAPVESLDDARAHLRRLKAVGAFSVKSYRQPRRQQRQQIVAAARELGMMVVPEGGSIFQDNLNMIVDGHTGIEHAIPVANAYADVVQLWSNTQVGYTPTMVVAYGGLWGENYWYQQSDVFAHPRLSRFVPPFVLVPRSRRRMMASQGDWNHFDVARLANKLTDAGVRVQVGAHGQREGLAVHWELWMLVQGGMSPHAALRVATLNGARYVGLDKDIGSLEPGKLADFAIIEGDVLQDIRASEDVRYTVINGRVYDAATMNQIGNHPVERAPFYWEQAR